MKVIYQDSLINLNYKDFPCHGAVIYNCCRNCLTVRSHYPLRWITPNNIHWTIEIVHDKRMLTNNACVHVTVKVCSLLSIIYQDCINLHGADHRWELPGNYPVFTVVMVIYHYAQRIWIILVTPNILYNIYNHE